MEKCQGYPDFTDLIDKKLKPESEIYKKNPVPAERVVRARNEGRELMDVGEQNLHCEKHRVSRRWDRGVATCAWCVQDRMDQIDRMFSVLMLGPDDNDLKFDNVRR